jgi:cell division protease FtsH
MVTQFGMSEEIGTIYLGSDQEVFVGMEFGQSREYSEEVAARIDREVAQMLAKCYEKAKQILTDHKERLQQLTNALLKYETLNRAEFIALMETGEVPEGLDADKPRTAQEAIEQSRAEAKECPDTEKALDDEPGSGEDGNQEPGHEAVDEAQDTAQDR